METGGVNRESVEKGGKTVTICNQLKLIIKKERIRINGDRLSPVEIGFAKRIEFANRDKSSRVETSCCRWKRLLQDDDHFIVMVADLSLFAQTGSVA